MAIELNDNAQIKAPKIWDDRYSVNGVTPYVDVAEANATIPLSYRAKGLTVLIGNQEYWYRDGITDLHLVPKGGGHIIQDNNIDLPQRPKLNFAGISIKAEDNAPNNATDVYFTGKVCGIKIEPLNFTYGTVVNFTKLDYIPNIDVVSAGLQITRDDSGEWLFNPLFESSANSNSPTNSSWYGNITSGEQFNEAISNLDGLTYDTFENAVLNSIGTFDLLANTLWIMKDDQNRYWSVFFSSWTITQIGQKATNYLEITGALDDGTLVEIGSRGYSYNLSLNNWTNDNGGVFTSLVDCINDDANREVNAFDDFGNVRVYALNDGSYGNSIPTLVSPMNNISWVDGNFLYGGVDASGGGGFQYQRSELIVLCKGNIIYPDGSIQTSAPAKIQNEGITLPPRQFINYRGNIVEAFDNGLKTDIVINGAVRRVINVDPNGDNGPAFTDPYNQAYSFVDLNTAVNVAVAGDLIYVNPGNYTPSGSIAKNGVDWYFCPNAVVSGSMPFMGNNTSYNVYGYATFINTGFAAPFFFVRFGSKVNITCNKFINQNNFYGCVYVEHDFAEVNFTCFGEVDCSYNASIAFTADYTGKLTVNAPVVKSSHFAYLTLNNDSEIIANVGRTILYDIAFGGFGSHYAGSSNGATNTRITINGDLFSAATVDNPGSALVFSVGCTNCLAILNGSVSKIRLPQVVNISNSPNCQVIVLSQVENIQETGIGVLMNTGKVTIKSKLKNADLSTTEVININGGGELILDNAVLVCGAGATESIISPVPTTIKVYSAYTNKPLNVNVSNSIVGTAVIVDPGIE